VDKNTRSLNEQRGTCKGTGEQQNSLKYGMEHSWDIRMYSKQL